MRQELLKIIEKNSRIDLKELAVLLGVEEIDVVNELAALEAEGIICGYHTLIDWEKTNIEKVSALIEVRVTPQRGQGFDSEDRALTAWQSASTNIPRCMLST